MRHDARWLAGGIGARPGRLVAVLAIVAVSLAVACDPNARLTPTPPPTGTPTVAPTPSPTPIDVAAEFIRTIESPAFSARAEIGGTISLGTTTGGLSGDAVFAGPASSLTMKVDTAGVTQQTQSISIGAKRWSRALPGPWLAEPDASVSHGSLSGSLAAIASVEDLGVVPKDGRRLHHLQAKGGADISPASIGFEVEGATDASFGMDFFTTDDGTPAIIGIDGSWTQTNGRVVLPVVIRLEFTLSDVGTSQTVSPPDDVWVRYTSQTFAYTMAHPADWTVGPSKTQDAYAIDGQPYVYVAPQTLAKGLSVDDFVASLRDFYKDDFGQPTSQAAATLGGQPAQRLIFEFRNDEGQDVTFVDDVTVRGRIGWEVFLVTAGGAEDIPIFDAFAASFAFTG